MSVTIKQLNGDSSFLLIFTPAFAQFASTGDFPGSFVILLDPWLCGSSKIFSSRFSNSVQKNQPCITSLSQLPEPDLVLISQDKSDHFHEETLRQLPSDTNSILLAPASAARKIRSWNHFDPARIEVLDDYSAADPDTLWRILIPPFSTAGRPGEVTIARLAPKHDLTGLHNAVGITYRAPSSVLSAPNTPASVTFPSGVLSAPNSPASLTFPLKAPDSPMQPLSPSPRPTSLRAPAPVLPDEKTVAVLYSPHGAPLASTIAPYAHAHLVPHEALPLAALLHSFDCVRNPWWLGGNVAAGAMGGRDIVDALGARVWVSAHDGDKDLTGLGVRWLEVRKYEVDDVREMLASVDLKGADGSASGSDDEGKRFGTEVVRLDVGAEVKVTV